MKSLICLICVISLNLCNLCSNQCNLCFAQKNMSLLGNKTYPEDLNDIWGYVDSAGNEYALVGLNSGVSVVDVSTDPANPTEVFFAPGANSIWRDLKTWGDYAYITNESSGGLMIIDLSTLPSDTNLTVTNYTTGGLSSAHNIFIDENGFAYLFGSNIGVGGALILDLSSPTAPVQVGDFTQFYLHDGMVRGDTMWGAAVYQGYFAAIDVSDKAAPFVLATQNTPNNFTHNCWISDDNNTLFTTDEQSSAFIAAYDVSTLGNITILDSIQSNPGSGVIPHNTHVISDFLVTSYYKDGVNIIDASRPDNMIEVGFYDTYTQGAGNGFSGCWGVYPWLPSGNIIASDIDNGLFVLGANYVYGCYLEGIVTDSLTGDSLNNALIEIISTTENTLSDTNGLYSAGIADSGTYDIRFSKPGYFSKIISGISLTNGVVTVLNAQLKSMASFTVTGQVTELGTGNPIPDAGVLIENIDFQYNVTTDSSGNFTIPNFFQGNYEATAGKWGYITQCLVNQAITQINNTVLIELDKGIYDDFTFDFSWTVTGTAATGIWERGKPVGTDYNGTGDANPGVDVSQDCSDFAYVTGNGGVSAPFDDVDGGNTVLTSPVFDLSSYTCSFFNYYRWFFNDGGAGFPNDTLHVKITNGTTTVTVESVDASSAGNSSWVFRSFKVSDYITPTATMQVIFETSDLPGSGHLVEAGVDKFEIINSDLTVDLTTSIVASCGVADGSITIYASGGTPPLEFSIDTGTTFQLSNTFDSLAAGIYSIIIRDSLNCTITIFVTVTNFAAPVIWVDTIINVSCNGYSNGSIGVSSSGGTPPYQYSIDGSPFQTNSSFTGLTAGSYLITVKDTNGCIKSIDSVETTEPALLTGNLSKTDESSPGANDGTASVLMSGGTPPYTYSWNPGGQTTPSISGLTSDVYTVTVSDTNGCTFIDSIFVNVLVGIDELVNRNAYIRVYPNPFNESTRIEYKLSNQAFSHTKMVITDILGKTVFEIALNNAQGIINPVAIGFNELLVNGTYFIKIINGDGIIKPVKLVKME